LQYVLGVWVAPPSLGTPKVLEKLAETGLGVRDVVENAGHDPAPALVLACLRSSEAAKAIELIFFGKPLPESSGNLGNVKPASEAATDPGVDDGCRRLGVDDGANGIEHHRAKSTCPLLATHV
jgi:hypothetical protein